jgi:phosphatidylserine/phosphatidylglycerophosphate/cardiolipin synthase-like enzyme
MHAKCAIADRECLFLTSANLSGNAMAINMKLGMCIHCDPLREQVERHSTSPQQRAVYSSNERVIAKGRSSS